MFAIVLSDSESALGLSWKDVSMGIDPYPSDSAMDVVYGFLYNYAAMESLSVIIISSNSKMWEEQTVLHMDHSTVLKY